MTRDVVIKITGTQFAGKEELAGNAENASTTMLDGGIQFSGNSQYNCSSKLTDSADSASVVQTAIGMHYEKNGRHCVCFDEASPGKDIEDAMPDGGGELDMAGLPGKNGTVIKFDADCLEVTRRGEYSSRMTFVPGARTEAAYQTPYGELPMYIETDELSIHEGEEGIAVSARYILDFGGGEVQHCEIMIGLSSCR